MYTFSFLAPTMFGEEYHLALLFRPKLTHPAARSLCNSRAIYYYCACAGDADTTLSLNWHLRLHLLSADKRSHTETLTQCRMVSSHGRLLFSVIYPKVIKLQPFETKLCKKCHLVNRYINNCHLPTPHLLTVSPTQSFSLETLESTCCHCYYCYYYHYHRHKMSNTCETEINVTTRLTCSFLLPSSSTHSCTAGYDQQTCNWIILLIQYTSVYCLMTKQVHMNSMCFHLTKLLQSTSMLQKHTCDPEPSISVEPTWAVCWKLVGKPIIDRSILFRCI